MKEINGFGMVLNKEETNDVLDCWNEKMKRKKEENGSYEKQPIENMKRYCWFAIYPINYANTVASCFSPIKTQSRHLIDIAEEGPTSTALFIPSDYDRAEYQSDRELVREFREKMGRYLKKNFDYSSRIGDFYSLEKEEPV